MGCWVDDIILKKLDRKEGRKVASGEWDLGAKGGRKTRPVTRVTLIIRRLCKLIMDHFIIIDG